MVAEVAFVVDHERVDVPGALKEFGFAESTQVGGFGFVVMTCLFLNTTAEQIGPDCTFTFPEAGVTDNRFHVGPADASTT